jgi:hypothetical protein
MDNPTFGGAGNAERAENNTEEQRQQQIGPGGGRNYSILCTAEKGDRRDNTGPDPSTVAPDGLQAAAAVVTCSEPKLCRPSRPATAAGPLLDNDALCRRSTTAATASASGGPRPPGRSRSSHSSESNTVTVSLSKGKLSKGQNIFSEKRPPDRSVQTGLNECPWKG